MLLCLPLSFTFYNKINKLTNLLQNNLRTKSRQQLNKIPHIHIIKQSLTSPIFQLHLNIIKTILTINFIIDSKTTIFMPNSLLIFGIDKDLENINKKTSMNDG